MKSYMTSLFTLALLSSTSYADLSQMEGNTYTTGEMQWDGITLLQKAANEGNALAQFTYAWALDEGKGIAENETQAKQWFMKSIEGLKKLASEGNTDAMTALGEIYDEGNGIRKDKKIAAQWYTQAVEKGHAYAMYALADLYKEGKGVVKSLDKAKELYSAAAKNGIKKAERKLHELEQGDD
ncbi:MAG: tetratricopeptide repeat protein [Akkermansia sp.]